MENKKCKDCGSVNPIFARFCRCCGSFFMDSLDSDDSVDDIRLNNQVEEIIELRKVLTTLSNDNSSLVNRFNNICDKNEVLEKEIFDKNERISQLKKEKDSLREKISQDETILNKSKRNLHARYIILFIFIVVVFLLIIDNSSSSSVSHSRESQHLEEVLPSSSSVSHSNESSYLKILKLIASVKPIIGKKVEVRNAGDNYNSLIISKETTYINPQIELISLIDGYVKLDVKFYSPDGLTTGNPKNKTPDGYSYTDSIFLQKNQVLNYELSGWGNEEKGIWPSGNYLIEIYYMNELIGRKEFTIIE